VNQWFITLNNNNNIIIRVVGIVKQADENSRCSFPCRARVSLVVIVVVVIINTIIIIYDGRGEKVDRKAVKERDERKLLGESPATVFVGRNESAGHFGVR
jgi:flagellar biosynthesis/type III secretory pathway M-ring protein FliF/YscJ